MASTPRAAQTPSHVFASPAMAHFGTCTILGFKGSSTAYARIVVHSGLGPPALFSGLISCGLNTNLPVNDISSLQFGSIVRTVGPPTSIFGSFLGGDASPRAIQIRAQLTF